MLLRILTTLLLMTLVSQHGEFEYQDGQEEETLSASGLPIATPLRSVLP